ncbi:MAG: Ig-like domain-containing protein [Clostridia bacterium]|nr:Ig-like domain-containing protein [Clostridia bacterium]
MTGKIRKFLIAVCLGVLCATSSAIAVSCSNDSNSDNSNNTKYVLTLKENTTTIGVGEQIALLVDSYNGERDVEWSSSDESVATVKDGVVTGVSAGSAIITAKAGSAQATCRIFVKEVVSKEENPTVSLALDKSDLYIGETVALEARVLKGATDLTGVSYEYVVSDENVISLSNSGNVTAKAEGKATITVHATWKNEIYSKAITVVVKPDYEVVLDQKTVTIDAIEQWNDQTYTNTATVTASVLYRGQAQENETVVWTSSEQDIVSVNNGLIKGEKAGAATVLASYTKDGRTYTAELSVTVQVAQLGTISDTDYEMPIATSCSLNDIDGYDQIPGVLQSVSIQINGAKYPIASGNASSFIIPERFSGVGTELVVETDKATASFFVSAYSSIENYDDLTALQGKNSGYYKLTADIDMTGKEWAYENKTVFSGTFDGGGREIKGLRLTGAHGLFYGVENEFVVTDLILSDVMIDSQATVGALFGSDEGEGTKITVKNVEANVILSDTGVSGGLFGTVNGAVELENVTVHAYQAAHDTTRGGSIFASTSGALTAKNVTVYSALWHTVSKNQPITPAGITLVAPKILTDEGDEVRLNFLSNSDTYGLQVQGSAATSSQIYYPSKIENGGAELTINEERLMQLGGKNIEIVARNGNNIGYYYVPVDEKGYLRQSNFQKLPYVTSGEVFLEEDIDFTKVTDWPEQNLRGVTFKGVFDGQNHKISNFNDRMFGDFCGTAKNFDLVNATTKAAAGYALVADLMRAGCKIENVSIDAKVSYYEKSGVLARYLTDGVNLTNVNIFAVSTRTSDTGFLGGFATKGAYVNCKDCLFVVTNENNSFAPYGIRDGAFMNSFDEMGENYSKVLRGTFALYNSPQEFIKAYEENTLGENYKKVYEEKFQTVVQKEVKEIKTAADLTEMLKGEASYYYLTADLDCTNLDWSGVQRDTATCFQVILEGNEHCIKGLPDYLFYNFQGRLQNVAFTDMQENASICRIARGGALSNVFLHGAGAKDQDGGLFAQEINAKNAAGIPYKGSGLYHVFFDNVTIVTTNTSQSNYYQGFVAGYATSGQTVDCNNAVFISKYLPIKPRTDKNDKGAFLYVSDLTNFLSGAYNRYTSANKFEAGYTGTLTALNQKYYELTKVLEEEAPPDTRYDGDGLVYDGVWTKEN